MTSKANVIAGKPKVGGAVFRAPLGTALPTDATTPLPEAFVELGYVSSDGWTRLINKSYEAIAAWGGDEVSKSRAEHSVGFSLSLIENLNDLDADIIFVKNIDNTVPDKYKEIETKYKKILAGVLVETQGEIFDYLKLLDSGKYTHDELLKILHFVQSVLNVKNPETKFLEDAELVLYLKRKLDRPCRVCGMVRNVGEPGGGPFLAVNSDRTVSPQILESSQIDMSDEAKKEMFKSGTHFNPVDIVCSVKDYRGYHFNLKDYVDYNTGFISIKSKNGKELKALELPGLWNGAMSDWNTIFVEVPIETFNPVKTVNDLLRGRHL